MTTTESEAAEAGMTDDWPATLYGHAERFQKPECCDHAEAERIKGLREGQPAALQVEPSEELADLGNEYGLHERLYRAAALADVLGQALAPSEGEYVERGESFAVVAKMLGDEIRAAGDETDNGLFVADPTSARLVRSLSLAAQYQRDDARAVSVTLKKIEQLGKDGRKRAVRKRKTSRTAKKRAAT